MKKDELQKLSAEDLNKTLAEKREELRALRFRASAGQLNQVHKIDSVKKTIARILTIMNK